MKFKASLDHDRMGIRVTTFIDSLHLFERFWVQDISNKVVSDVYEAIDKERVAALMFEKPMLDRIANLVCDKIVQRIENRILKTENK